MVRGRVCRGVLPLLFRLVGLRPRRSLSPRGPRRSSGREPPPALGRPMSPTARASVSLAILLGALLVVQLRSTGEAVPIRKPLDSFPATLGEWQGRRGTIFGTDILDKLKLKDYVMRDYGDRAGRA